MRDEDESIMYYYSLKSLLRIDKLYTEKFTYIRMCIQRFMKEQKNGVMESWSMRFARYSASPTLHRSLTRYSRSDLPAAPWGNYPAD